MNRDTCLQLTGVRINNRSPASNGRALPEQDKPRSANRRGPGGQPKAETHRQVPEPSAPENLTRLPSVDRTRCIPAATELAGSRVSGTHPSQAPRSSAMPSPSDNISACLRADRAGIEPVFTALQGGFGTPVLPTPNKPRISGTGEYCPFESVPLDPRQLACVPRHTRPTTYARPELSGIPGSLPPRPALDLRSTTERSAQP